MAREIYNFIWAPPPEPAKNVPVAHQEANTVNRPVATARAVILFPSLLTPLVYVDSSKDPYFELLIAADKDLSKLPDLVNRQLKVSLGLDPAKAYDTKPLFGGGACDKISVTRVGNVMAAGSEVLKTATKFEGILHPSAGAALSAAGLSQIYAVKLHKSCLPTSSPSDSALCSRIEPKLVGYVEDPKTVALKRVVRNAVVGGELSDKLIRTMLEKRLGKEDATSDNKAGAIPGQCRYAFPLARGTVDLSQADASQPVQSYHPLVVFTPDAFDYASVGHFSDLHVNCRWQLVAKSPARVIEYGDGQHEDESPPIGKMLSETNRSVENVMSEVFASDASLVVVGGDLIDHIRNTYNAKRFTLHQHTVKDVWNAVDLDTGFTEQSYPYGIDMVAFYSLIVDAVRSYKKPAFAISGNHDCYVKPFGISPRVRSHRANEGIPADLNLTFYEAILAFGPTSGLLTKVGSSFDKDWFEWFYLVFSPFNDWWHKLPKQSLVGLGWGNEENIMGPGGDQGAGHLPRSSDGVSSTQLGLLNDAVAQEAKHKVTLTTHFTFLSYNESIPMRTDGAPTPGTLESGYRNRFEYGTFQENREAVLALLKQKKIQCVLTGHSHRRGTYLLLPGKDEQNALMFDASGGLDVKSAIAHTGAASAPAIIVSDSAGPYPRHNGDGEFVGWGSDRPGGTLVTYDSATGGVASVTSLQASSRPAPRVAVALDYADIMLGEKGDTLGVFEKNALQVSEISFEENSGAWGQDGTTPVWSIWAFLTGRLKSWNISATRLVFGFPDLATKKWLRVETVTTDNEGEFVVPVGTDEPGKATKDFRKWLTSGQSGFVSMQFATSDAKLSAGYNWSDYWNFEAVPTKFVRSARDGAKMVQRVSYGIMRPSHDLATTLTLTSQEFREVPNFAWRQANLFKYQITSL